MGDSGRVRVCHVITRLIAGGAQEHVVETCARLPRDRYAAWIVTGPQTGPEGSLHHLAADLGVEVEIVPQLVRELAPVRDLIALVRLWLIFRRTRPHIVHTNSSKAGILGRLAARFAGVPAIVHTVHGWSFHEHMPAPVRGLYERLERVAARWTQSIVVVADVDREKGTRAAIGRPEKYETIRSGIDVASFARACERERFRDEFDLPAGVPVVGTVTRLVAQKDPSTLVSVFAEVAARSPEARFVIVGDGPLRADVEAAVEGAGLGDRVRMAGLRSDVADLLGCFDVFVLTSLWEGLPRVIPEAMAAGVPVVASSVGGVGEAISDGVDGLLVPPRDAGAFGDRIGKVLADRELAARLRQAGRRRASDFDVSVMIGRLDELYRRLAETSGQETAD